jgi:hypothetical protein
MSITPLLTCRKEVAAFSNYADAETCRPRWARRLLLWWARGSARLRKRRALVQIAHEVLKAFIHAPCLPDQRLRIALQPDWKHLRIGEFGSKSVRSFTSCCRSRLSATPGPLHMSSCKKNAEDPSVGTPLRENLQLMPEKLLAEGRPTEPEDNSTYDHPCSKHGSGALQDRDRWLSCHRTSHGIVVYYRCSCGSPAVALLHPDCSLPRAGYKTAGTESVRRFAAPVVGGG